MTAATQHAAAAPSAAPPDDLAAFRAALKRFRDARRWSQEKLAFHAGMDHSLVSRLESGQREPTREAVGKLAAGLALDSVERDLLLAAAGYFPEEPANLFAHDPQIARLLALLLDPAARPARRAALRAALDGVLALAEDAQIAAERAA